jgi:hypothetical protein
MGKDHPVALAFPLPLIPVPWAPKACWDQEVVRQQEILQGKAGDLSNLWEGVHPRWIENRRKEQPLCVGIVWTEISSEKKLSMNWTKINFWRTDLTIDLIIVVMSCRVFLFVLKS